MKRLEFNDWSNFKAWVEAERSVVSVYWRGQRNPQWALSSSFEREILRLNGGWQEGASMIYPYGGRFDRSGKKTWSDEFYHAFRDRYLNAFQRASSGLRGPAPAHLDTDQWWSLGRHHGLITPLLDWSESPYIAAFFPLTEVLRLKSNAGGGISFFNTSVAIYRLVHNEWLEGDGLRVVRPLVDELGRMQSQRGLFTWLDSDTYFELAGFCDNTGREGLLTQAIISGDAIFDGLRDLRAHGIDSRLLFPDLNGAAEHANMLWDFF
jgi:hypothetical protein